MAFFTALGNMGVSAEFVGGIGDDARLKNVHKALSMSLIYSDFWTLTVYASKYASRANKLMWFPKKPAHCTLWL